MRILGIDPGSRITGFGLIEARLGRPSLVEAGAIRLDPTASLETRLTELFGELSDLVAGATPDQVAVEKLYSHYKHPQTAVLMGHARGVILLVAAQKGVPIKHLAATEIKKHMTGHGRAGKDRVRRAVAITLGLSELPGPPDVADALATAIACGHLTATPERAEPLVQEAR